MSTYQVELSDGAMIIIKANFVRTDGRGAFFYKTVSSIAEGQDNSELIAFVPVTMFFSKMG